MDEFDVNEILRQNFPKVEAISHVYADFQEDTFLKYNELIPDVPAPCGIFKVKNCLDTHSIVDKFYIEKYSFRDLVSRRFLNQKVVQNMAVHMHLIKEYLLKRFPNTYIEIDWCYDNGDFFKARQDSNAMEMQVKVKVIRNPKKEGE